MSVVDDFLTLLEKMARGSITHSEREALRSQFLRMMTASSGDNRSYGPAVVGSDADKLEGQHGSFYQNASNINAGTLSASRYNAYDSLVATSKLGTGALQVPYGNHSHGGTVSGNLSIFIDGTLAAATDAGKFVLPYGATINSVNIVLDEKGTAGSTIVDVHKNGTTIFTTQDNRPTAAYDDADGAASGTPDVTSADAGDIITIDIDAVATGAAGLGVIIAMSYVFTSIEPRFAIFTVEDTLVVTLGKLRIYNLTGVTKVIQKVQLSVSNAPTGAAIIVDVNKDGTTLFTTQSNRPQIAAGDNTGITATVENNQWANGEYLTLDIDQVGSTSPGYNLAVLVEYL